MKYFKLEFQLAADFGRRFEDQFGVPDAFFGVLAGVVIEDLIDPFVNLLELLGRVELFLDQLAGFGHGGHAGQFELLETT